MIVFGTWDTDAFRVHVLSNSLTKTSQSGKDTAFDRLIMSRSNVPVSRDGCCEWYPLFDAVAGVVAIGKDPSRKGAKEGTKCGLGKLVIFSRSFKGNFRRHGARSYRAALASETGSQQPAKEATCWRISSGWGWIDVGPRAEPPSKIAPWNKPKHKLQF